MKGLLTRAALALVGAIACQEGKPSLDRPAAEQHVVRERQHTKKSRKQRLKELQRKAFEGN